MDLHGHSHSHSHHHHHGSDGELSRKHSKDGHGSDGESDSDMEGDFSRKPRLVLIFTVTVDAFVDGFLIGLCLVSNFPTALVMALATSLEMGFLGLAYGTTLHRDLDKTVAALEANAAAAENRALASSSSSSSSAAAAAAAAAVSKAAARMRLQLSIPPVVMVLAGVLGVSLGEVLLRNDLLFLGMLSFASVSLIFLVTQELLVEARESIESPADLQCVTISLFVGLFIAFLMSTTT